MAEIAVAVLEVHEVEAAGLRAFGGGDVIVDQPPDVVVRHHRILLRDAEFPVEHRVAVEDHLLELAIVVRLAEAARMGELEADDELVVTAGGLPVGRDDRLAQTGDGRLRRLGHHQLERVGAPVMAHRHRLAAIDELRPALAEPPPPPHGVLGRGTLPRAVPALDGVDGEAVADGHAVDRQRRGQRLVGAVGDDVVAGHVRAQLGEMRAEAGDAGEGGDLREIPILHGGLLGVFLGAFRMRALRPAFLLM